MRKKLWIVSLIIGIIPFAIPLVGGLYYSIKGYAFCLFECDLNYGFEALSDSIVMYSFIMWPTYIVGIILIIISVIILKMKKSN